uniref:Uncharacterized protein n=1 Tax=Fagus sylvatica TaxID=28930 RepID=A0A2N9J5H2_FAGSY
MGYLISYRSNVDNLKTDVNGLKDARQSVDDKVKAARNNVEEIEANVSRWLTSVEEITTEKIQDKGIFHTIGHRVPIRGVTPIPTKGFEDFESRKTILEGIMKALKDDNIHAIGVCGMGGLGKTMLVGKVATQAMEEKLFETVVTVVVSQSPNLKQIQKDIAKELGLKFEDEDTDFHKSTFTTSFEEDMNIEIAFLWRILVGLEFFQDVYRVEEVRNRVHTLVESLKASGLLLDGNGSGTFKMHDIIRDVAIYIADKDKKMLTIRTSDDLEKWSNKKLLKDFIGISLFDVKFSELPKKLDDAQLNFIFLYDKDNSSPIPNHFFERVKELRVLVLQGLCLPLPSSLSCLHNLQALVLHECEIEDVAIIGELKKLKALTISTSIKKLPVEIGQLTHLQLLDLKGCNQLEVIPCNMLSNLKRLEELYMNGSFNQWHVDGESTERSNARVLELDHLSLLTTLCIHIPNAKILPKALLFEKLVRYKILIGSDWDWNDDSGQNEDEFKISKKLKIELDRNFQSEGGIKILLKSCEYLDLQPGKGIRSILYEVDQEGFPQLKHLYVRNSVEIQYIINSIGGQQVAFPILESISLINMSNLEKICHDQLAMGSFRNLKKLEVGNCDNLIFVFSSTMVGCFLQLENISIQNCKVMNEIVAKERENEIDVNDNDNVMADIIEFTQLRSLDLGRLPNLMGFHSDVDCHILFNEKV